MHVLVHAETKKKIEQKKKGSTDNGLRMIGLVGYKQSGKDTMADYLVQQYGYQKLAFADPLKKVVHDLFHISDHHPKEAIVEPWGFTLRQLYQKIGTDLFRNHFSQTFWVDLFDQRMDRISSTDRNHIVVADVRYQNEADCIRKWGGSIIYIDRFSTSTDAHSSEQLDITPIDTVLVNRDSITFFYSIIDEYMTLLARKSDP